MANGAAAGELLVDMRADREEAFGAVFAAVLNDIDGSGSRSSRCAFWPGMDAREIAAPVLEQAAAAIGRPVAGTARGGASDARATSPRTCRSRSTASVPRGFAHNPHEHVLIDSPAPRAELALAVVDALLDD